MLEIYIDEPMNRFLVIKARRSQEQSRLGLIFLLATEIGFVYLYGSGEDSGDVSGHGFSGDVDCLLDRVMADLCLLTDCP